MTHNLNVVGTKIYKRERERERVSHIYIYIYIYVYIYIYIYINRFIVCLQDLPMKGVGISVKDAQDAAESRVRLRGGSGDEIP